ncbi:NUDIX domain-containing protein [Actinotalea sp. C106]|uniref:NUDIX domain-containing protein n=1 Tax=Actinotalea sp. C106 TaxID=2908644 RepID=UPI00202870E9|nr:NUDIX domain-containing protein [Actinotalea sp. C106]
MKGQFWVQVGGHLEAGDGSVAEVALHEAREESGVDGLPERAASDLAGHLTAALAEHASRGGASRP